METTMQKEFAESVARVVDLLAQAGPTEQALLEQAAGQVVGLRDTQQFNRMLKCETWLNRGEIQENRRALAAAIAAEKWADGFKAALVLLALVGAI